MQNPGYDAWGICGLIILAICLIWLGINKLRDKFQKSKKTNACDYEGGGIKVLSEEDTEVCGPECLHGKLQRQHSGVGAPRCDSRHQESSGEGIS